MKIRFLAPSRAHRWTVCPGSVRAEAMAPTGEDSMIANEGTAAHHLFDMCLKKGIEAETMIGEEMLLPKNAGTWTVDEDMVQHIQDGVDLVKRRAGKGKVWTEQYIELKLEGVQCGGTLDSGWYGRYYRDPLDKSKGLEYQLHILDLKYGYGSVAEPRNNKQIRIYASGKLQELRKKNAPVDRVHLWIYQPRLDHIDGPFLHDTLEPKDLDAFVKDLKEKIEATKDPKAPRVAGQHCLYCAAHATCPTAEKAMYRLARNSFSEDDAERVGSIMFDLPMLKQWIKAVQDLASIMAQHGAPPVGWILGSGRRSRQWDGDKAKLVKELAIKFRSMGLSEDDYAPRKILGVAKVRTLVPKDKQEKFDDLWHWTPGRERLQPVDNARHVPRLETYFDDEGEENEFLE